MRAIDVRRLGLVRYDEALEVQRALVEDRKAGRIPDTLLLLEHPHVLTLGVRTRIPARPDETHEPGPTSNIIVSPARLAELGVEVFETGRGGDVTYHGPGQVVGYPILDLRPDRQDVHRYVRDLEEVLIRCCGDYGVSAERIAGLTGAWVARAGAAHEKVAAIGVRISRWVTSHGFALNVNADLDYFRLIVPCGISDRGVTSLQALSGSAISMEAVEQSLIRHFCAVFDCAPIP